MNQTRANTRYIKRFLIFSVIVFFSCGKDNLSGYSFPSATNSETEPTPLKMALMAHTWRLDSAGTASVQSNSVYERPRRTMTFSINKYSEGYESTTSTDSVNYEQDGPVKIYYWAVDGTENPASYFLVESVTDTSLTLLFPNDDNNHEWFHTK